MAALRNKKMIEIFGIKNCDTMKKAFGWLDANKFAYTFMI